MSFAALHSPEELGRNIERTLSRFREAIAEIQADGISKFSLRSINGEDVEVAEGDVPDPIADLIEEIAVGFSEANAAVQRLATAEDADGEGLAAVKAAWNAVATRIGDPETLKRAIGSDLIVALKTLIAALDAAVDLNRTSDTLSEDFDAGNVNVATLQAILDQETRNLDLGAAVPDELKNASLISVEAQTGGWRGTATISFQYDRQLTPGARAALQRKFNGEIIEVIRREAGEKAVGAAVVQDANTVVCEVLFATNRTPDGPEDFGYARAGKRTYGLAHVSVPNRRKRGAVPRPWRIFNVVLESEKADRHIVMARPIQVIDENSFLAHAAGLAPQGAAFLFVHGFNTPFKSGLYRTAQIAVDLDLAGPVLHYSWPSRGKPSATWYNYDGESINASKAHFIAFVTDVLTKTGVTALNVIAHSRGNQLVLDALDQMASAQGAPRGTHLVLASPDVDVDVATARLASVPKLFDSVTLYANAFDRPLWFSGGKARRIRAGTLLSDGCPLVVPEVFSIDSNRADFELLSLNHDAYMDAPPLMYDIGALFRDGQTNPNKRTSTLLPTKNPRGLVYYRLADGVRTA